MIVKIGKAGASFVGLGRYLTDAKERVAWTHSLNCANEFAPSVINEMYTTFKDAEFLKEQSGQHGGGTPLEKPVKHISLSWHPDEHPTKGQMIEAAMSFLKEMGAEEHQAFLVAHDDKDHQHVHIMLNRVHPETGLALKDGFEFRRAQAWALEYEREHGKILCEQRLLDPAEREPSPSRSTWEQVKEFEKEWIREEQQRPYDPSYLAREERREVTNDHEWELLKALQEKEREDFFHIEGRRAYRELRNQIYREVREEMRPVWRELYATDRDDDAAHEFFIEEKRLVVLTQQELIRQKFEEAASKLREERNEQYKALLLEQKEERHELAQRQEMGLSSPHLLERQTREPVLDLADEIPRGEEKQLGLTEGFKAAAAETTGQDEGGFLEMPAPETAAENPRVRHGFDAVGDLGLGALGAIAEIGERLFDGFFGGSPPANQNRPPQEAPKPEPRSKSDIARDQAVARAVDAAIRATEADRERQQDQEYWRDRERSRGYRD